MSRIAASIVIAVMVVVLAACNSDNAEIARLKGEVEALKASASMTDTPSQGTPRAGVVAIVTKKTTENFRTGRRNADGSPSSLGAIDYCVDWVVASVPQRSCQLTFTRSTDVTLTSRELQDFNQTSLWRICWLTAEIGSPLPACWQ